VPSSISTIVGADSVTTLNDIVLGSFQLRGLPVGKYTVFISPLSAAYRDTVIDSVEVVIKGTTNLGIIPLGLR